METLQQKSEYEKYQEAVKKVKEIKGFYSHMLVFIIVLMVLMYINLKYSPEYLWFIWTMFGWGIGVFFHAAKVFDWFPFLGKNWEQEKIKQFMNEENSKF